MKNQTMMIERRRFLSLSAAAGLTLASGLGAPALAQSGRTLRFGSPQPRDSLYNRAIEIFAEEAGRLSDGAIKVENYPGSELGGVGEMLSSVQAGALDMTIAVPAWYSNFIKPMDVFTLPYLVGSTDRLKAALDGRIGEMVSDLGEAAGFRIVGHWLMGGRHLVNKVRPIRTPADVEGLKLRVINSEVYFQAFRALGANPVAMDPAELYVGLQQGVVDGFAYPLPDIVDAKLHEVSSYLSLDHHVTDFFVVSLNAATWNDMSSEEQEIIRQAMKASMDFQWQEQPKAIDAALAQLRELLEVNDIPPEERQKFADATRPVYANFEGSIGKDLLEAAMSEFGSG